MWRLGRRPGALPGACVAGPAALAMLGGCSCSSSQQPSAEVRPRHVLAEGRCGPCSGAASLKACLTLARCLGGPRMWPGGGGAEWPGGPGSVAASGWVLVPKVTCALAGPPPRQSCGLPLPGPTSAAHARLLPCQGSRMSLSPEPAATLMPAHAAPSVPQRWGCLCVAGRQCRGPRARWP